jgi:hypothetical protein
LLPTCVLCHVNRSMPQDIAASALVVALGDTAFFQDLRCYNEIAVAVYERTPVLLCLAPGVVPPRRFLAMLREHPLRTLVLDAQQEIPALEGRIGQAYAVWVQEESHVHRTPARGQESHDI